MDNWDNIRFWRVTTLFFLLMALIFAFRGYDEVTLIQECEQNLKRTQHCKIVAIPEMAIPEEE